MTTAGGPGSKESIDVILVSSWFPSVDDPVAGRFVADQAEALAQTGRVRPWVVTFERSRLSGGSRTRRLQEAAIERFARQRLKANASFHAPAWGVAAGVPVLRVSVAEGRTSKTGDVHEAVHREAATTALADRLLARDAARPGTSVVAARGIVHAHRGYPDGSAAGGLAARLGWPLVVTEHASFVPRILANSAQRRRYEATLRQSARFVAVSGALAGELQQAFPALADRISVVPNAVDVGAFAIGEPRRRVPDSLLFVGVRRPTKGIETLLRALDIARRSRPGITLRLVGRAADDASEERWRALAAELGLDAVVRFQTTADRGAVATAMAEASVFVHPSPRETFGIVAAEALASGTPVVACDSGGVTEILGAEPDALGAVVPPDRPDAFAAAIVRVLERRETYDPHTLRAAVEARFGPSVVAERLVGLYGDVLDRAEADAGRGGGSAVMRSISLEAVPASTPGRAVLVALDRSRAREALTSLPLSLGTDLTLVTSDAPRDVEPAAGRVVEIGLGDRRLGATAPRGPLARIAGLLGLEPGGARAIDSARPALRRALAEASSGGSVVVPVDGQDHLAVRDVVSGGSAIPVGSLQTLADASPATAGHAGPVDPV